MGAVGMPVESGTLSTGALARADGIAAADDGAAVDGAVGAGLTPDAGVALTATCAGVAPEEAG
jgi:hypothetical protein